MKKSIDHIRKEGVRSFSKILMKRFRTSRSVFMKPDVLNAYRFLKFKPSVAAVDNALRERQLVVNWYVPALGKGSGGHLNIFRFLAYLQGNGFRNNVIISDDDSGLSADRTSALIKEWYGLADIPVYFVNNAVPSAAISIATSWKSAYAVDNLEAETHKVYFVQDFEPWFFPAGTEAALAEQTYRLGFYGITAGSWLANRLADQYGMKTTALGFSYDRALYKPHAFPRHAARKRIFFYVRPPTARRAFDLGVLVFAELARRRPDITVVMAGWDVRHYALPFDCDHAGLQDPSRLAQLYSSCDAALVLSFTNLSLLPVEIMACGVPVVSNTGPYTQWLLSDQNSKLAAPSVEGLADALEEVLFSLGEAERLRANGLQFAQATSWDREGQTMVEALRVLLG